MIDKKSVIIGIFAGMVLGIITSVFLASILINAIGESFQVENMNITIALNQTSLEDVIRESPGYQTSQIDTGAPTKDKWVGSDEDVEKINRLMAAEYDRGYLAAMDSYRSNILFAGSTFEYNHTYFIKAQDILSNKVEIDVFIQNGDYVFNGTCYENAWCNIRDISFQIDDIHIGKEAAYFVYWSDK